MFDAGRKEVADVSSMFLVEVKREVLISLASKIFSVSLA